MAGGENRKRRRIEDGVDRISELSVHLREHILGCLSIDEAVATSILSSKWRYCWTGLRKLEFDHNFWHCDEDNELAKYFEHAWAVDRVLMLHCGPIHKFILSIPQIKDKTVDINVWLRVLSNNGVRKIKIATYQHDDNSIPIPSCLFHCRELEKLKLRFCTLTPPSDFKGFSKLTSLSLESVDVAPRLLESLISRCPLLETLSLAYLALLEGESLALEALNLKTFYFDDGNLESIIFKNIPKLTCVSLLASYTYSWYTPVPESIMLERLCSLSKIKELTFDLDLLETSETCPSIAPTPLKNLKSLTIRSLDLCLSNNVLFTLYLMRNAPNLQNLTLHLDSEVRRDPESKKLQGVAAKLLKSEARKHTSYNSLQTIKIGGIKGLRHKKLANQTPADTMSKNKEYQHCDWILENRCSC